MALLYLAFVHAQVSHACFSWQAPSHQFSPKLLKLSDVKPDIVSMFEYLHKADLDLCTLNFAMLTLIPKIEDAKDMKHFRPISLINCSFKIFSKVLTLRLGKVLHRLISLNQSAFLKGRYILESVVVALEIVHSLNKSNSPGLFIKLDYEKAYDRVSWDFLFEVLKSRGFSSQWISWIDCLVRGGSVGVNLNGGGKPLFQDRKRSETGGSHLTFVVQSCGRCLHKTFS
jgi:hypothetical protein